MDSAYAPGYDVLPTIVVRTYDHNALVVLVLVTV